jgi:hypothetical protein
MVFSLRLSFSLKINLEMIDFLVGNQQFEIISNLVQSKVILELYDMENIEA